MSGPRSFCFNRTRRDGMNTGQRTGPRKASCSRAGILGTRISGYSHSTATGRPIRLCANGARNSKRKCRPTRSGLRTPIESLSLGVRPKFSSGVSTPTGAKWLVSIAGGHSPQWLADGKELFYIAADGNLMAVAIEPDGTTPMTAAPKILFQTGRQGPGGNTGFGVSPDGQRFLLRLVDDQPSTASIVVVTNWPELLKRH